MSRDMIDLLRSALGDDFVRPTPEEQAQLEQRYARARAAWPRVELPFVLFGPYVVARMREGESLAEGLSELSTDDLYLACGCTLGDPAAIATFEAQVLEGARGRVARVVASTSETDDLMQAVRQKLLVGDECIEPRIASYGGRGDLRAWVKVVAVREALMARRGAKTTITEDDALEQAASADDPELDLMRTHYQEAFRDAFAEALQALEPGERNLLRYHLVDRLSIDRIAAVDGVHRATAARRLARIREKLHTSTRTRLTHQLRVDGTELESILRLVRSRLELSVRRLLTEEHDPRPP